MEDSRKSRKESEHEISNKNQQGVDKAPGEETGKGEQVTIDDLKGKKVDADPEHEYEQPIRNLP